MIKRYLPAGVIAVSVLLLATALITAKTGPESPKIAQPQVEITDPKPSPTPKTTPDAVTARDANLAKAVLTVQGMSCSGCINEIKSALSGLGGTSDVLVDLSSGRVEVYYDPVKLTDPGRLAASISAKGYPATLQRTLTTAEIEKENSLLASRSKLYIAAVGDWQIPRSDFDTELNHARKRYEKVYGSNVFTGDSGTALLQSLQSQVISRLVSDGIQMQEIRKSGFKVPPETVQLEFNAFLSGKGMNPEQFRLALDASGYDYAYFLKKFENRVTIDRYIEENILSGISNDLEKQQRYFDWYNNARLLAKVVYYDRDLEKMVQGGSSKSGCGSSCTRQ